MCSAWKKYGLETLEEVLLLATRNTRIIIQNIAWHLQDWSCEISTVKNTGNLVPYPHMLFVLPTSCLVKYKTTNIDK